MLTVTSVWNAGETGDTKAALSSMENVCNKTKKFEQLMSHDVNILTESILHSNISSTTSVLTSSRVFQWEVIITKQRYQSFYVAKSRPRGPNV